MIAPSPDPAQAGTRTIDAMHCEWLGPTVAASLLDGAEE